MFWLELAALGIAPLPLIPVIRVWVFNKPPFSRHW